MSHRYVHPTVNEHEIGAAYAGPPECYLCWQWRDTGDKGQRYRQRHGLDAPATHGGPCRHRGSVLDRRERLCGQCWRYECELFRNCIPRQGENELEACCDTCPLLRFENDARPEPELLLLENRFSPGDVLVMTAAVESLHQAHPQRYVTAVSTTCPAVWEHNPRVHVLRPWEEMKARRIDMLSPLVDHCNERPVHFLHAYCDHLERQLGVPVPLVVNHPLLYFSPEERSWIDQVQQEMQAGRHLPYWIMVAGGKDCYTAKLWGRQRYQELVHRLAGKVLFVQIGKSDHLHPALTGVLDFRGRTDDRQLLRLCLNAQGGVGPSTFVQHIFAALQKPYVLIGGGREPVSWTHYPTQTTLSRIGTLPCCRLNACWKSRTVPTEDGRAELDGSICERVELLTGGEPVPACLASTSADDVASAMLAYYNGGVLEGE